MDEILVFLKDHPMWLSGFACGEGCFTGYLSLDLKSLWGLQPGLDFNITQNTEDILVLKAINLFFNKTGGVYSKPNNVSVVAFINVKVLKEVIIPFYIKYPLLGSKSYEFERWVKLVDIYYNKKHIGKKTFDKNYILEFSYICKNLNSKRLNVNKQKRMDIIIDWLVKLKNFPTMEDKLNLIKLIKMNNGEITPT